MKYTLTLSTGKQIELTRDEFQELQREFSNETVIEYPMPTFPIITYTEDIDTTTSPW